MSLADSLAAKLREAAARGELPVSEDRIYSARPDATLAAFEQMRADAELGAAWREAEAALPEGWRLAIQQTDEDFAVWAASAVSPAFFGGETEDDDHWMDGQGPTSAAALRALTVKLQEART